MADIASGAGVSRTALYHYFPGKEELLRAVIDELLAKTLNAAIESLEKSKTLEAALTGLLEAKFGRTLAVIAESSHGVELVGATHRFTGPAIRAADEAFQALLVKALVRYGQEKDASAVADTLIAATQGLMKSTDDAGCWSRSANLDDFSKAVYPKWFRMGFRQDSDAIIDNSRAFRT